MNYDAKVKTLLFLILSFFLFSFLVLNMLINASVIKYTYKVNGIATKEKVVLLPKTK